MPQNQQSKIEQVSNFLTHLQNEICTCLETLDQSEKFSEETITYNEAGFGRPRVLSGGEHIEKAAVNFTKSSGSSLPATALTDRPQLTGAPFEATSLSVIVHPLNPFVPTTHLNLRFFYVLGEEEHWHFGGGYDLTPCYGFEEDAIDWHTAAASAAGSSYDTMRRACDEYFYLPHRDEHRGIGGLFFDNFNSDGFDACFEKVIAIGESFIPAYSNIFSRRRDSNFTESQKHFQLFRRGRYVEFNLVIDRGTRYGLETGRRVESVLASLPPLAGWRYHSENEEMEENKILREKFLKPRDWTKE